MYTDIDNSQCHVCMMHVHTDMCYMQTELCLQPTLSDTQTHNVCHFETVVDNVSGDCIHTTCYICTNGNTHTNTVHYSFITLVTRCSTLALVCKYWLTLHSYCGGYSSLVNKKHKNKTSNRLSTNLQFKLSGSALLLLQQQCTAPQNTKMTCA